MPPAAGPVDEYVSTLQGRMNLVWMPKLKEKLVNPADQMECFYQVKEDKRYWPEIHSQMVPCMESKGYILEVVQWD